MSVSSALTRPITAVAWTSNSNTCPSHYTLVNVTEDGASGNFSRGLQFGSKGGYYLCYSKDSSGGMVVADVQIISDKDTIPHGYRYISEFLEHKTCVGKKKRVCARLVPAGSVNSAVLELRLTIKNKSMLQQFTCLGDMHGFVLWCLKGPFSAPGPQAKPRSVSLDLCSLSLDGPGTTQPLKPSNAPMAAPPRLSHRRCTLDMYKPSQTVCETSNHGNIHSITAMDGVPFSLHPKFEPQCNRKVSVSALSDVRIKSVQDIENEYNYAFVVEEQAAKRICPTLSES